MDASVWLEFDFDKLSANAIGTMFGYLYVSKCCTGMNYMLGIIFDHCNTC